MLFQLSESKKIRAVVGCSSTRVTYCLLIGLFAGTYMSQFWHGVTTIRLCYTCPSIHFLKLKKKTTHNLVAKIVAGGSIRVLEKTKLSKQYNG